MANVQKTILSVEESALQTAKAIEGKDDDKERKPETGIVSPAEAAEAALTPDETAEVAQAVAEAPSPEENTLQDAIAEAANRSAAEKHRFLNRQRAALKARLGRS